MLEQSVVDSIIAEGRRLFGDDLIAIDHIGSGCLPWIRHPNDVDILFWYKGKHDDPLYHEKLREQFGYCPKKARSPETLSDKSFIYQYYYAEHLYGESPMAYFLPLQVPEELKQACYDYLSERLNHMDDIRVTTGLPFRYYHWEHQKFIYHAYICKCLIDNNSYELTDAQINKVNILHDMSDGWEEIAEEVADWLDLGNKFRQEKELYYKNERY